MINGITLKVCGITSVNDAVSAVGIGADYLGFIFHPKSPRCVSETKYQHIASALPATKHVAVLVEPSVDQLARLAQLGFAAFQIHFKSTTPDADVASWVKAVAPRQVWLAPQLPPGEEVKAVWLDQAHALLIDTFHADKVGGTGQVGDWPRFKRFAQARPDKTWILAGGLSPENIVEAVSASGTQFIDVNSGVESAPGVKSQEKLFALWRALERL